MKQFTKQIKKGLLELVILKLLNDEDLYGYSLIQKVKEKSNNFLDIKDGTLYPILYRLEDSNMIESYWEQIDTTRSKPRKYYKITDNGKTGLNDMLNEYLEISKGINLILNSEVNNNDL